MNREKYLNLLLTLFATNINAALDIRIEPSFWWCGMKNPHLQLMIYGNGIRDYIPSIDSKNVQIEKVVKLESPNYLLIYLNIEAAQPGNFNILFSNGEREFIYSYALKARKPKADQVQGFDSSDVLYLIMPDRFANGNPANDQLPLRTSYKVNRRNLNARHGGDLAGIEQHLDYLEDLGITAIWLNPVLENDMDGGSYHGYATTNYYQVDPRLGSNEDYLRLIDKAHQKGLKVVMDMIFNHCGKNHPWMRDIPCSDWFNNLDHYVQTNHAKEIYFDPYVSDYDKETMLNGWFVASMPDLNQKNPHVAKYLIQNSIWWIEYSGIDGIRQDTYPYADTDMMRDWCLEVMNEYPNFNIVGEVWMNYTIGTAFWQKGSKLNPGKDTELKTVMDFRLMEIARNAFHEETQDCGGLNTIFEHMCYDFVYPDIYHVLRFLENHDTFRFLPSMPQTSEELYAFKQGITFLLTIPGIPQLYYGQELLMHGNKEKGDGSVRLDFPGGWQEDPINQFKASGRNKVQNEAWNFLRTLLQWRKGNDIISKGSMKHFKVFRGVYLYERRYNHKSILVVLNGSSKHVSLPLARYEEVLRGKMYSKNILTGRKIFLKDYLSLSPKKVLILELPE